MTPFNYFDVLDKRICDVEDGTTNTETYREFIYNSCVYFGFSLPKLNNNDDVIEWLDFLNDLWDK